MIRFLSARWLLALLLVLIAACTPMPVPTEEQAPSPAITTILVIASPTPTPSRTLPATATVVASSTATPPAVSARAAVTPALVPPVSEGGSLTLGAVGTASLEVNVMPAFLSSAVFDSLLRPNPQTGALEPGLAESWQVSPDATTFLFRLRKDVRWHNGEPFTARDVVATLNALSAPEYRGTPTTDFGTLIGVSAPDDYSVQVSLRDGYCPALTSIGTVKIMPRAVVQAGGFPRLTAAQMIGTGPLKLVSAAEDRFVLAKNGDYFMGAPHIESWTLRLFSDASELRAAFLANQVDMMAVAPEEYRILTGLKDAVVVASNAPEVVTVLFNLESIALNDPQIRQALNYAVDRSRLRQDLSGHGEIVNQSAIPGFWASPQGMAGFAYDPAKARQLLAQAGWRDGSGGLLRKDGKPLSLDLWTEADDPIVEPIAFRLREMYAALGIDVQLELDDKAGWITRAFQHRFDLLLTSRRLSLDPDQRWYWQSDQNVKGSGFNFGSYSSARVDGLYKESVKANGCDAILRSAYFGEINRNLMADAPAALLLTPQKFLVAHKRLIGLSPSPFAGDFWNLEDWGIP